MEACYVTDAAVCVTLNAPTIHVTIWSMECLSEIRSLTEILRARSRVHVPNDRVQIGQWHPESGVQSTIPPLYILGTSLRFSRDVDLDQ